MVKKVQVSKPQLIEAFESLQADANYAEFAQAHVVSANSIQELMKYAHDQGRRKRTELEIKLYRLLSTMLIDNVRKEHIAELVQQESAESGKESHLVYFLLKRAEVTDAVVEAIASIEHPDQKAFALYFYNAVGYTKKPERIKLPAVFNTISNCSTALSKLIKPKLLDYKLGKYLTSAQLQSIACKGEAEFKAILGSTLKANIEGHDWVTIIKQYPTQIDAILPQRKGLAAKVWYKLFGNHIAEKLTTENWQALLDHFRSNSVVRNKLTALMEQLNIASQVNLTISESVADAAVKIPVAEQPGVIDAAGAAINVETKVQVDKEQPVDYHQDLADNYLVESEKMPPQAPENRKYYLTAEMLDDELSTSAEPTVAVAQSVAVAAPKEVSSPAKRLEKNLAHFFKKPAQQTQQMQSRFQKFIINGNDFINELDEEQQLGSVTQDLNNSFESGAGSTFTSPEHLSTYSQENTPLNTPNEKTSAKKRLFTDLNKDEEKIDEEKIDEEKIDEEKIDEEKIDEEKIDEEKIDEDIFEDSNAINLSPNPSFG